MADRVILLVEDNRNDEMLTIRALQARKIANEVIVVRDGAEALDYLFCRGQYTDRDPREFPEVVLLDLKLPKVDGLEVLKELRENERTKSLPVVVLTSSNAERDLIESYRLGANGYVCKPVDSHQFADAVAQLGLYWLMLNQSPPL